MNKKRIISGKIILVLVVAGATVWLWIENARQPGAMLTSTATTPKVIAPAHVIPPDVSQNMQMALAAREQKLQQLAKSK